jgi:hypothetical protein
MSPRVPNPHRSIRTKTNRCCCIEPHARDPPVRQVRKRNSEHPPDAVAIDVDAEEAGHPPGGPTFQVRTRGWSELHRRVG